MKTIALWMAAAALAAPAHAQDALSLATLDVGAVEQEWGSPQRDKSVDGNPLRLGDRTFAHGIGTHANSRWVLDLKKAATRFTATVGVDSEKTGAGSCRFVVKGDGRELFRSAVLRGGQAGVPVDVSLRGVKILELIVEDAGDGIDSDHGDWAEPTLTLAPGATVRPIAAPVANDPPMKIWMGPDSPIPAIHGPRVVGSTPGKPFLFRIPATGQKPLRFSAKGLPDGISLDPEAGILTGSLRGDGTTVVDLEVRGPRGVGRRKLAIVGGKGKLALTPPLGWNSWNVWAGAVDDAKVRAAADQFVATGLADHGFAYVNIDDCWEAGRDSGGKILANEKFPDMRALSDYVHSKGLKFGIYSSPGPQTCAGFEGSFRHEVLDANRYAEWGVDYLKYDWCSYGSVAIGRGLPQLIWPYRVMQRALEQAPRDITYSLCQYGMGNVWQWGAAVGGNCWRTTGDITDTWNSMAGIGFGQDPAAPHAEPGHWNDPDMLVVGWVGWGPSLHPTRLKPNEQITHISLWSLHASPLLIGCDLTRIDGFTKALLTNDEVLDVNQDPLGKAARRVAKDGDTEVWARPLFDGTWAVGLFNRGATRAKVAVRFSALELSGEQPVRDLWQRRDLGVSLGSYAANVPAHGAILVKIGTPTTNEYVP